MDNNHPFLPNGQEGPVLKVEVDANHLKVEVKLTSLVQWLNLFKTFWGALWVLVGGFLIWLAGIIFHK